MSLDFRKYLWNFYFQTMFPVVVGVKGVAVLFTSLLDSQSASGLFFAKDSLLVEFDLL